MTCYTLIPDGLGHHRSVGSSNCTGGLHLGLGDLREDSKSTSVENAGKPLWAPSANSQHTSLGSRAGSRKLARLYDFRSKDAEAWNFDSDRRNLRRLVRTSQNSDRDLFSRYWGSFVLVCNHSALEISG